MTEPVLVCKKCKGHSTLVSFLEDMPGVKVEIVGCQKICKGPVAGTRVHGVFEWFVRVNKKKPMAALAVLAHGSGSGIPGSLRKRRMLKRSGRRPR